MPDLFSPSGEERPGGEVMNKNDKIYIAGHRGMVGSAIHRRLKKEGFENFVFSTSDELDLRDQQATAYFFDKERPDFVFLAAAMET